MGTKVHCERYLPGFNSMRDPNEGSSSCNWPLLYGDKSFGNGQYGNGYLARTFSNSYSGGNQDAIKQKMLEHEAVFRHQVVELHRLYKTQKDMMDVIKRKELYKHRIPLETSSSSSPLVPQKSYIPYLHSNSMVEILNSNPVVKINSPSMSSARGNINQDDRFLSPNGASSNDCEILEVRPSKVKKKLFDLQLPGDEYINPEEEEGAHKLKAECNEDAYVSSSRLRNPTELADLNEPLQVEEVTHPSTGDSSNSLRFLLGLSKDVLENSQHRSGNRVSNGIHIENKGDWRGQSSYTHEGHNKTNLSFISQGAQRDHSLVFHKPMDTTLSKVHLPQSIFESTHGSGDLWREKERTMHNLQTPETSSLYHQKPVSTLTQKLSSIQPHPYASSQSQDILNRVYPGPPPPWIKDPPPRFSLNGLENSKIYKYDKVASEHSINYSPSIRAKEMNLNLCPSKSSYIEIVDVEKECEDQVKVLPWLKKTETLKVPDQVSSQQIFEKRIFGVPIFDKSCCTMKDSSTLVSTSASVKEKGKSVIIDINIACDIDCNTEIAEEKPLIIAKSGCPEVACSRALFDLNSCVTEDELSPVPSASTNANNKRIMIDLEAPPVPESDEDVLPQDEAILVAAEAIVTISSFTKSLSIEAPSEDSFLWFVEVVCNLEHSRTFRNEIDDFEASTLSLIDLTEREYMPEPLVPDFPEPIENGNISARSRNRRGVARRGTRKRDFQRDILPGLMSLSRHEVSEDIQTFGGLMKATGHIWSSGLTKRNGTRGGGRGRKRAMIAPPDDDVAEPVAVCPSLTEAVDIWGRTPRRPRRQRGAPGKRGSDLGH